MELNLPDANLAELISKVGEKDLSAFAALYKCTSGKLFGVVYKILRHKDLAGDALQEAYVKIWLNAANFDLRLGSPLGWMTVIARNLALDMVRRVEPTSVEDMPENWEPFIEFDPLESRDRHETLKALLLCLSKLDSRKRAMLMMAYYNAATRAELSVRFGVPVPTIKTQLRRALAELKQSFDAERSKEGGVATQRSSILTDS
jgi:RNA polymerase sigma-70 factor, ECF subfamily